MAQPTPLSGRIEAMDVLRGVAVLGILIVNINVFALPLDAMVSIGEDPPPTRLDKWVYSLVSLFAAGKFMSLFALLFGAGVSMMVDRRWQRGEPAAGLHFRRVGVLAGIGFIHGVFIWFGDILLIYALCGMLLYPMLKLQGKALAWAFVVALGLTMICMLGYGLFTAWALTAMPEDENAYRVFQNEIELMRGDLLSVAKVRFVHWLVFMFVSPFVAMPWVITLMLLGVIAKRGGWITAERSTKSYVLLLVLGLAVGLPLAGLRTVLSLSELSPANEILFLALNVIDALAIGAVWLALVMLLVKAQVLGLLRRCLSAVGRMALTNYLTQSLICTTLFYGYGFGWFASFSRTELLGFVFVIWLLQLVWSPLWLARFQRGPLEAAWRWSTYSPTKHRPVSSP